MKGLLVSISWIMILSIIVLIILYLIYWQSYLDNVKDSNTYYGWATFERFKEEFNSIYDVESKEYHDKCKWVSTSISSERMRLLASENDSLDVLQRGIAPMWPNDVPLICICRQPYLDACYLKYTKVLDDNIQVRLTTRTNMFPKGGMLFGPIAYLKYLNWFYNVYYKNSYIYKKDLWK